MAKTAQLEQFDDELYKVTEDPKNPDTDKYLIATSEQPISALHEGEWLLDKELPIKWVPLSACSLCRTHDYFQICWLQHLFP